MDHTFWLKQTAEKPLFPDILWSRPEHKAQAGKLLIVGGNAHGFSAPAAAFAKAATAGIGSTRVLLPNILQKTVGRTFPAGEYAPSTPSGSFSQKALTEVLSATEWADGVLLAGDFGHNSETAILLEKFIEKYSGQLTLAQDTLDYFLASPAQLLDRERTLLVPTFSQLQKLARTAHFPQVFTSNMDLLRMVEHLHDFTEKFSASIIVEHSDNNNIIVATGGQVSTTKIDRLPDEITTASHSAVWWLQNPSRSFEALSTSVIQLGQ